MKHPVYTTTHREILTSSGLQFALAY